MKIIIKKILKILAKAVLDKYKPDVIAVTGSVGKTSTKEAIYTVLERKFSDKVRRSIKNYNNEIGVPLTILGCQSAHKSLLGWLKVFSTGLNLVFKDHKNYPQVLVLEMGADRVGDIKYLTSFIPRKAGVIISVGKVHYQFFNSMEKIIAEKQRLISDLKENSYAILNVDDQAVYNMRHKTKANVLLYGFSNQAQIKASDMAISEQDGKKGTSFKLAYDGKMMPIFIPQVLGKQQIYAALAGTCAGIIYGMNLVEISEALRKYCPPPGRMNLIHGIKNTLIIDDTYNASPLSTIAALESMEGIVCSGRKIAILGDMLELGSYTEEGHQEVGKKASQVVNLLITVGERARDIGRGAIANGFSADLVFNFNNIAEAGKFAQNRIKENDLILIKGSQGIRMEKITKELMAEPLLANELLVRQEESWQ